MAKEPKAKRNDSGKSEIVTTALAQYQYAYEANRDNTVGAYDDLRFAAGDQWPGDVERQRKADGRPCLTVNMVPKFLRQVTGDIRQMRPAVRVIGVDDGGDVEKAEAYQDIIRYIERRSDAQHAYFNAADSTVAAGIGYWRIETAYDDEENNVQDICISAIYDGVGVVIDPDSDHAVKLDASFGFVPVDFTWDAFKKKFPTSSTAGFTNIDEWARNISTSVYSSDIQWFTQKTIRVVEYFTRTKEKDGWKVKRHLLNAMEELEPAKDIACDYIPLIPLVGEEVHIGPRVVRRGMVRLLRDPQRMYNYLYSTQAEVVALQPKAPFILTAKNIEDWSDLWQKANTENLPYLVYDPDPANSGQMPQRGTPPLASSGIELMMQQALEDMKSVTGLYDASIGAKSNEQSGKAILARERQGDTGQYHFTEAFMRALRLTGIVLVNMIPRIYDTQRVLRVLGEDGAINETKINQLVPSRKNRAQLIDMDVTTGKYDVAVESGPSFNTRRDEAREGMNALLQAAPDLIPLIGDLYVGAMDWPEKEKIASRLKTMLPPAIKAEEDEEAGEGAMGMPNRQPTPQEIQMAQAAQMQQAAAEMELRAKQIDLATKEANMRKAQADAAKVEAEALKAQMEAQAAQMAPLMPAEPAPPAPMQPDPMEALGNDMMRARAMKELEFEFEGRRKKLERDAAQTSAIGLGEEGAEPSELGPAPIDILSQALAANAEAIQAGLSQVGAGMQALAQAQMAPKQIVRSPDGRVMGVEPAI